ncbi:globoside alpha-1 [Triplophysa rosa]|uniref:Globoside alpha-1 n=1 Tax=Triplophysa rosa TaxID=992332 RepID=A0A9W7T4P7_TRIRA|nr:globoside alpha-1 [Triplophysa rosa]
MIFLKDFLESAEAHYFVGYRVHYYLFTDQPEAVPNVKLGEERKLIVRKVPSSNSELDNEADYIFCFDVDAKFYARWSAETLSHMVAVIHPWFYNYPREKFTYERRPESEAFIPADEGDFYYAGGEFGGSVQEVHKLTKTCTEKQSIDRAKSIEALWHNESHLNRYFLYNKPSKLLSPEYLWRDISAGTNEVKVIRFTSVAKNMAEVRPNI